MSYDSKAPKTLCNTLQWLGAMIQQPLQADEKLPVITPFGTIKDKECCKHVAPSQTLQSHERVELYHQQYWWRLLKNLQLNYPMVTRLFGYSSFNQEIGIPYLTECPAYHWALRSLGESLPDWIRTSYNKEDQELVASSAEIDLAANLCFFSEKHVPVDFSQLTQEEILSRRLFLQSYIFLFSLKGDLFSLREELLKQEVEYWCTHPFPELTYGKFYFVVYRTPHLSVAWKELSYGEYQLLTFFIQGLTIKDACEKIEKEGGEFYNEALEQLPLWFREWTSLGWFY